MGLGYRLSAIRCSEVHPTANKSRWRWLTRSKSGALTVWQERPMYDERSDDWIDPYGGDWCPIPYELGHLGQGPILYLLVHPRGHVESSTDELSPAEIRHCERMLQL